jgi:DsbC/DsbD-like thiol-disulfide interchange protein
MTSLRAPAFLMLLALALACAASRAQTTPESHAQVELIPDINHADDPALSVGILFKLDPGWHIYWQNPGDSGVPPHIDWMLSPGLTAGPITWPQPTRLGKGSVIDYGYENQVLLRTIIRRHKMEPAGLAGAGGAINATVKYVVCREICIPATAHLNLNVADAIGNATNSDLFRQTRAQIPRPAPADWNPIAASQNDIFVLWVKTKTPPTSATFYPLEPNQIENSAAQTFTASPEGFRITLHKSDQLLKPPVALKGVLVFSNGAAYEVSARVFPRPQDSTKPGVVLNRLNLRGTAAPQRITE